VRKYAYIWKVDADIVIDNNMCDVFNVLKENR